MKKNDNLKEERKGFWKVGYLEQQDYTKRILELTHREVPQNELDQKMEEIISQGTETYYDEKFKEAKAKDAVFMTYNTGENAFRTNNAILAGFHRIDDNDNWRGVYLEQDLKSLKTVLDNQRRRRALEDYSYIYHYDRIAEQCDEMFGEHRPVNQWANQIGELFVRKQSENKVHSFETGSYFKSDEKGIDDEDLFYWMERNDKPGARQKGFGITLIDKDDLLEKWAEEKYKYTLDRLVFDNWDDLEEFVKEVAGNAMEEDWGRINAPKPEQSYGHPVLKSYVEYTLVRLRILDKKDKKKYILREENKVYYNTGLLNEFFRQILISADLKLEVYDVPGIGECEFEFFLNPETVVAGHDTMFTTESGNLKKLPRIANYFEEKEDVLYDASLQIMLNDEHIFEDGLKAGRIPMFYEQYQQHRNNIDEMRSLVKQVQARVETAIRRAQLLAERNHKLAVPQFWKEDVEVQFLLPLYMEESHYVGRPQCAIALRRSSNGGYYEGATILSLDMAYNNARLIAKPDAIWLNRKDGLEDAVCGNACSVLLDEQKKEHAKETAKYKQVIADLQGDTEEPQDETALPPNEENIGKTATLSAISMRPGNKGIKGVALNSGGTIARNLLKKPPSSYTNNTLKVKIIDINPQGTQYILEPIE